MTHLQTHPLGVRAHTLDGLSEQLVGGARHQLQLEPASLDAGELEQLGDQVRQAVDLDMHATQEIRAGGRVVERAGLERFHERLERGDRRAELVRDVGDEIAAGGLDAPQLGHVLEQQHGTAAVGQTGGHDLDPAPWRWIQSQLDHLGDGAGGSRRAGNLHHVGVAHGLGQRAAVQLLLAQQVGGGRVAQLDALVGIQDEHAVGHVLEDGGHLQALALNLGDAGLQAAAGAAHAGGECRHFADWTVGEDGERRLVGGLVLQGGGELAERAQQVDPGEPHGDQGAQHREQGDDQHLGDDEGRTAPGRDERGGAQGGGQPGDEDRERRRERDALQHGLGPSARAGFGGRGSGFGVAVSIQRSSRETEQLETNPEP